MKNLYYNKFLSVGLEDFVNSIHFVNSLLH